MNSNLFPLFLSLLIAQGCLNIGGVDQKGAAFEDVVGTDGIELQKVFNRPRNDPTPATELSDDEETDLETARYGTEEDGALKNGFETSLAGNGGRRASEDETRLKKNEGLLTSGSDRKGNGQHDTRINRNFELKERLNIDSDRSKDQRHAARDSTTKVGQKKLVQSAEKGQAAEFEASIGGDRTSSVPVTNSSASTPPPYILKLKHPPAKAELDDIYFLFIVIGCSVAGIAGLALAGYCWYKLHTTAKAVSEAEYAGYGSVKQGAQVAQGDHKLDYSAEIYHYHQTKSQLSAMEKANGTKGGIKGETLDDDDNSDEGDDEDYTVYECHGLAPTGDMTVVNPLFSDQEVVGSDQDANGERSGASGHGSPVPSRHTPTDS